MSRHVHIVINPKAGQAEPALTVIHRALEPLDLTWDVSVVKPGDDVPALVRRALSAGADVIAGYGGDGTVSGIAKGLVGTDVPLAVLPGGTANVLSVDLGLPTDLAASCGHLEGEAAYLDVIELDGGRYALVHVGTGFSARAVAATDRASKNGLGRLAYTVGGLQALWNPPHSAFELNLDGRRVTAEGAACMVCNTGLIGQGRLTLSPDISVRDGWLDVVVLRDVRPLSLLSIARDLLLGREPSSDRVLRWRAREIEVEAAPPQEVQADGDLIGTTPLRARVLPGALRVIVPEDAAIRTVDEARVG